MFQYIAQNYNTALSKIKIIDLTGQKQEAVKSLKPRKSLVNNPLINFKRPSDLQLTFYVSVLFLLVSCRHSCCRVRVSLPFMMQSNNNY